MLGLVVRRASHRDGCRRDDEAGLTFTGYLGDGINDAPALHEADIVDLLRGPG